MTGRPDDRGRAAALRELVVQAGLDVLDRHGLGLRPDTLTYAKVFAYIEEEHGIRVTRGSVHERIWSSQDEFRLEVLAAAADHQSPYDSGRRITRTLIEHVEWVNALDLDPVDRVRTFARMAGPPLFEAYLRSEDYRRFQATKAAARAGDDDHASSLLREIVRERSGRAHQRRNERYAFLFRSLGLRARRELGLDYEQATDLYLVLLNILVTGAHLDHWAGFSGAGAKVETDLVVGDDEPAWTCFSFGVLAVIELLFEPDHEADRLAALDAARAFEADDEPGPELEAERDWSPGDGRARRSRAELRRLVTTSGVELFVRDGLGLKPETLTYASVFAHIQEEHDIVVHRSTVHPRIWSSHDEFRVEVLAEAARSASHEVITKMAQAAAATPPARNLDGSINARQTMLDNVLAAMVALIRAISTSKSFARWQSIKASVLTRPEGVDVEVLGQAVRDRFAEALRRYVSIFRAMFADHGHHVDPAIRMSEDQAVHLLAVLCATLVSGYEYSTSAGVDLANRTAALPRVDGSARTDDWPIMALGIRAAIDLLFIEDEDAAGEL